MKKGRLLAIVAGTLLLSAATAGISVAVEGVLSVDGWPQFQRDEVNSGRADFATPTGCPATSWSRFTYRSSATGIEVVPIAASNTVYVYAGDGLWAFNEKTGLLRWKKNVGGNGATQTSTPAYGDGKLFIATSAGRLLAFDASTGAQLWDKQVSERGFQCPVTYHDNSIYIGEGGTGGDTNCYYRLDDNGNTVWKRPATTAGYLWCGASVIGDYLVYGNVDGVITSVNRYNGSVVDELDLKSLRPDAGRIRASVSYQDGYVYTTSEAGADKGYIWKVAIDPGSGEFLEGGWNNAIGFSTSTPVVHEGEVFVGQGEHGHPGSLVCLNDATGEIIWSHPVEKGVKSSPVLSLQKGNAYIYFTTAMNDGWLYCLNGDGDLCWKWNPPDSGYILQGVSVSEGSVFLGTSAGYLYALEACFDWDVNCDSYIDVLDEVKVGMRWGEIGTPGWIREDVDHNGVIGTGDIAMIEQHWTE